MYILETIWHSHIENPNSHLILIMPYSIEKSFCTFRTILPFSTPCMTLKCESLLYHLSISLIVNWSDNIYCCDTMLIYSWPCIVKGNNGSRFIISFSKTCFKPLKCQKMWVLSFKVETTWVNMFYFKILYDI